MNLILFEEKELEGPLNRADPRARHILEVLRRQPGDEFDAGLINSARGRARLIAVSNDSIQLEFHPGMPPPPLPPLGLIIGLPRPQTARKILNEATTLGVSSIDFVCTDRGEPSYAQSSLWSSGEWRRHLLEGAQQAFCTRLPVVSSTHTLDETLKALPPQQDCERLALDNYESPEALSSHQLSSPSVVLALGSERGWTTRERELLRKQGFAFLHLGPRVLRTETAVITAAALTLAKLGSL